MDAARLNERRGQQEDSQNKFKFDGQSQRNGNGNGNSQANQTHPNTIARGESGQQQQFDSRINNNNHANDSTDNFNLTIMSDYSSDEAFNWLQQQPRTNIVQPKGQ